MYVKTSCNVVVSLSSVSLCTSIRRLNVQKCQGLTEGNNIPVTSITFLIYYIVGLFNFFTCTHMPIHVYMHMWWAAGVLLPSPQFVLSAYIFLQADFMYLISVKLLEVNICNIAGGRIFNYMFINESYRKQVSL